MTEMTEAREQQKSVGWKDAVDAMMTAPRGTLWSRSRLYQALGIEDDPKATKTCSTELSKLIGMAAVVRASEAKRGLAERLVLADYMWDTSWWRDAPRVPGPPRAKLVVAEGGGASASGNSDMTGLMERLTSLETKVALLEELLTPAQAVMLLDHLPTRFPHDFGPCKGVLLSDATDGQLQWYIQQIQDNLASDQEPHVSHRLSDRRAFRAYVAEEARRQKEPAAKAACGKNEVLKF